MKRPLKYNPGFLGDREIAELFCVRHQELDILIRTLEKNKGDINRHIVVIGPRGSGKTMLLRRLATEIRAMSELYITWHPIVFMEENYEILSLSDFWKEALYYANNTTATTGRRLEQLKMEIPVSSEAKDATYEALKNPPGGPKNPYTEDIARARLLEFAERQGKRLLLICENMNDLFSVLSEQECWKLRNVLQTEKRIMLIGSATARFDQIDHHKKAFYDFFKILNLERLTTKECAELWFSVSGNRVHEQQAEALRILTGGLPRLVSILAWFGRELSFLELMRDLEELIDDHTDYFKGSLETLPPKERKVFVSLARLWANSPVGIIADEAGMEQPETSAILNRLIKRGIVEEYEEEGKQRPVKRGKTYQLTERLFNIFYLMRRGGAEALFIYDVVDFLIQFFGNDAENTLREFSGMDTQNLTERELHWVGYLKESFIKAQTYTVGAETKESSDTLRRKLEENREKLGPEHPDTLISMNKLAITLYKQGHHEEAEKLFREILELRRHALGPEHPDTLSSMNNLAGNLGNQGRYEEAEKLHRETLELRSHTLGPEAPDTLRSMNNLAVTLNNQGRYEEAEKLHRETLEMRRHTLGPEHPDTLISMNNLAGNLDNQGRYEEAEKLHRETLELRRHTLGPEHPDTLISMGNLAFTLDDQNRYEDAEKLFRETLELRRHTLGPEHPDTLMSMNNLASNLGNQGRYEEAEKLHRETLELCRHILGPEHPNTLISMGNLAFTLDDQGRYEEAEKLYRETLELFRHTLGPEEPDALRPKNHPVLKTLQTLFSLHCKMNKTEPALSELSELLQYPAYVRGIITSLADGCIKLAAASTEISHSVAEAIEGSLSKDLLYPLYAGIRLYLGDKMRLPREVRETAKVIRERIKEQKRG
ncbi:MAG: tetratricopeptide repeat protein [Synergistaceae bacterium]|nr:tetratricopeptide repeat protein [Synergistaceae bacterium]